MLKAVVMSTALFWAGPADAQTSAATNETWIAYGGVPGGGRYSALDQINRDTVDDLEIAWTHSTGHAARAKALGRGASYQVTPLYVNNLLYICTPLNRMLALDPETGEEVWAFDPHEHLFEDDAVASTCRGVAYWEAVDPRPNTPCEKRVFKGDRQGRMFAVDADSGDFCSDFGTGGFVDLKVPENGGTGRVFMTSPQAVLGDSVIIGGAVGDNVAADSTDGVIRAIDVRSGALLWRLVLVPEHLSDATGGADVWPPFTVDVDRNVAYIATGSPSVDVYGAGRTDPIPYANALLAVDGATGTVLWHYQIVHHDLFDYDLPSQPILTDVKRDGVSVPAVVQITKMGTVFAFNRDTGKPLFPIEEQPAPVTDIPGEVSSPTQPMPRKPEPFSHQAVSEDEVFGLTFWDRNKCKESFRALRYDGMFTPASEKGTLIFPSPGGGGNWGGAAVDPTRQVLIVKGQNFGNIFRLVPAESGSTNNGGSLNRFMEGTPYRINGGRWESPFGVPCNPPPWGEISAIDLNAGETLWRRPLGQVPFGPFGLMNSPKAWGGPISGGPMITAGGLIFIGATMEGAFRALDISTGNTVWSVTLDTPAMAVPMTYAVNGKQYVVIAAGGSVLVGTDLSDQLVAFALPN
jgi:quinoprotein glucose dehydrogenase